LVGILTDKRALTLDIYKAAINSASMGSTHSYQWWQISVMRSIKTDL